MASSFGAKIKDSNLRLKSAGEPSQRASQQRHFLTGGVLSKKFELISPKICRAGGIPPQTPLPPARRSDPFGLDDFKFFVPLLAELWASPSLAANSFQISNSSVFLFPEISQYILYFLLVMSSDNVQMVFIPGKF